MLRFLNVGCRLPTNLARDEPFFLIHLKGLFAGTIVIFTPELNFRNCFASYAPNDLLKPPVTAKSAELTDDELLQLLRNERTFERGFRLLIARYQERLYRHIRHMVQDHTDADDVLQNTLIKVHRGIAQFEGKSKLYTWLYRIATNESISFLQSRNRRQTQALDDSEGSASRQLRADEWFDGEDLQRRLHIAIGELPDKQRVVFNLRYFEEMPYEEMSKVLDTSVGALKASFHHAVKKIEAVFRENNQP